ncbi:MAG: hypothetical protein JWO52_5648 [Gammaproteobacteria bacterium]|nr:hypothetical protein [Gammaproteobacteria bacterium]
MFSFFELEVVHWDYWRRFKLPLGADIVTVVGPNGSGKTTLLDALRTLLSIQCSSGRDYRRYVRHADQPYTWLRAVVSNERRGRGSAAFFPITNDRVTLLCRINKKGGDWERSYGIAPGVLSIEEVEKSEAMAWKGVRQYESELEGAGLTRAIKRVLALDQGQTDKLCEYSGRQLLELVFNVFGDQEVLDNYQSARKDQAEVERELRDLETQMANLGIQLRQAEGDVNSYHEYQALIKELADLQGLWLPRIQLAELVDSAEGGRKQLIGAKRELQTLEQRASALVRGIDENAALERAAEASVASHLADRQAAENHFLEVRGAFAPVEALLKEEERLQRMAREQAADFDPVAAAAERDALTRRRYQLEQEAELLDRDIKSNTGRLAALESGSAPEDDEVREFRAALRETGIGHRMLAEILEITDTQWQGAVEAVLRGVRHIVLLEKSGDRARAWQLGERERYPHFVVPDRELAPRPTPGSLAECVRFSSCPPAWLARLLNSIQRVPSATQGALLPPDQSWITPVGYWRERRGARYAAVRDFHFGQLAIRQLRERLVEQKNRRETLPEEQRAVASRLGEVQALLDGVDAGRHLAARASEFAQARLDRDQHAPRVQEAGDQLSSAQAAYREAEEGHHAARLEHATAKIQHDNILGELDKKRPAYHAARTEQIGRLQALRQCRRGKPPAIRSADALDEARQKYRNVVAVQRETDRLDKRRAEGRYVSDPTCIAKRDKLFADHEQLGQAITDRKDQLQNARRVTSDARGQYINVLRATVRLYAQNIRSLGEIAGIGVEVEPPHLENDDLKLAQAQLNVNFTFDDKSPIGLNDGEASGGQQVMKSMILLVGLMMDERRSGGFVFIDEPFAHLDIFNIDKVGAFLEKTQAQYILTTPNTHNVNVFKPSDLTLVTFKRRPKEKWAPAVAFLRRDRGSQ